MERWTGKVAVVTGASAGIGLATAKTLVQRGLIVVGFARRKTQMEESMENVKGPGKFLAKECDITKEESVIESLNWVKNTLGAINILINNAGAIKHQKIEESTTADLEHVINVNILGLLYCTKNAIPILRANQNEAHIVNVNSVLGHKIPPPVAAFNVYPATKFAVTALSETLKNELLDSKIRVTNISPGLVKTNMMDKAVNVFPQMAQEPALNPEDVAHSIIHILSAPPHVEITELTLTAKRMS